jgi:hypothetical protein
MAAKRSEVDAAKSLPSVGSALRKLFTGKQRPNEDWSRFWTSTKNMGLSQDQVHAILNVKSMKEWVDIGKNLDDAILTISEHLAKGKGKTETTSDDDWDKIVQADVPPADTILPNGLNLTWVKESLATLQSKKLLSWSNVAVATHLRSMYQVEGEKLTVMLGKLTKEQVGKFVAEVSKAQEGI